MYKKIIITILLFLLAGSVFGGELEKGKCSPDLILHQNLNTPKAGQRYIKNGIYNKYTGEVVREAHILQKHLNRLGFNAGPVDGIIGPKTKDAILKLQKHLGTKADGYVGPKTRALLNNSCGDMNEKPLGSVVGGKMNEIKINLDDIHSVLSKGVTDQVASGDVLKLQKFLNQNGYKIKYFDGIFGNEVETALKKFNKDKLGYELDYFDPRLLWDEKKGDVLEKWEPRKIKLYLGYGTFDWFYLNFPFEKEKIDSIYCGGYKKDYIFKDNKIIFPLSKQTPGKFTCKINIKLDGKNKTFDIVDVYFRTVKRPTTKVNLIKKYATSPSTETQKRISNEVQMLGEIYKKADKEIKFSSAFIKPLDTKMISPFGKVRIFNNGNKSVHSGTDYRAQTPLPVKAVNDGEVILAGVDLYYCGKGIIINHGMNLFSTYCHLSEQKVKTGDKVKKGQIIGLTGATGRVSGPHLHLSMKYNGGYIDFEELQKKSEIIFR